MKKIILTVDDSKTILKLNSRILNTIFPDFEILSFQDPAKALADVQENLYNIHFALLDYNMDHLTGLELAQELSKLGDDVISLEHVALVSANIQAAVQKKALDIGVQFIDKPLSTDKLKDFLAQRGLLDG